MKIAISCIGGGRKLVRYELVKRLQELGHTVFRVGARIGTNIHPDYRRHNVKYLAVPLQRSNTNPLRELVMLNKLWRALASNEIEAVIAYGIRTFPSVVLAARLAGVKRIVCIVNGSGKLFQLRGWQGFLVKSISFPMLVVSFLLASTVLFQNPDDLRMIRKKGLLWRQNVDTIDGSGVNLERFRPVGLPKAPVFSMISRLTGSKGVNEFVQAARIVKERYPDARFNLIGPIDTDYGDFSINMDELNLAVETGVVDLKGEVDDVMPYLQSTRVFVLPSYYPEGIPRSILEAMACGLPVITSDSPGCRETVVDGENGFLVPPRDHQALADKMIWMMENGENTEAMGIRSRILCERRFDIHRINDRIISFLS